MKNIPGIEENTVNGSLFAIIEYVGQEEMRSKDFFFLKGTADVATARSNISTGGLINILCAHTRSQEDRVHTESDVD